MWAVNDATHRGKHILSKIRCLLGCKQFLFPLVSPRVSQPRVAQVGGEFPRPRELQSCASRDPCVPGKCIIIPGWSVRGRGGGVGT